MRAKPQQQALHTHTRPELLAPARRELFLVPPAHQDAQPAPADPHVLALEALDTVLKGMNRLATMHQAAGRVSHSLGVKSAIAMVQREVARIRLEVRQQALVAELEKADSSGSAH